MSGVPRLLPPTRAQPAAAATARNGGSCSGDHARNLVVFVRPSSCCKVAIKGEIGDKEEEIRDDRGRTKALQLSI